MSESLKTLIPWIAATILGLFVIWLLTRPAVVDPKLIQENINYQIKKTEDSIKINTLQHQVDSLDISNLALWVDIQKLNKQLQQSNASFNKTIDSVQHLNADGTINALSKYLSK